MHTSYCADGNGLWKLEKMKSLISGKGRILSLFTYVLHVWLNLLSDKLKLFLWESERKQ